VRICHHFAITDDSREFVEDRGQEFEEYILPLAADAPVM
jgi:hypothetical protein